MTPLSPPWLVARLSLRGRPLSARGHAFGCVPIQEEEAVLRGAAGPDRAIRGHRHHEEASRDEAPQRGPRHGQPGAHLSWRRVIHFLNSCPCGGHCECICLVAALPPWWVRFSLTPNI